MSEDVSGYARERCAASSGRASSEGLAPRAFEGVTVDPARRADPDGRRPLPRLHAVLAGLERGDASGIRSALRESCARRRGCAQRAASQALRLTREDTGRTTCPAAGSPPVGSASAAGFARLAGGMWIGPTTWPADATSQSQPLSALRLPVGERGSRESTRARASRTSPASSAGATSTTRCWRRGPTSPTTTTGSGGAAGRARERRSTPGRRAGRAIRSSTPACASSPSEGFMPNRARLIVASFLTKTLGIDWRAGALHFERLLVDGDLANNVGNWQWVAGTGNDTRPNRVLNPIRQARRFDPDGAYVRRLRPGARRASRAGRFTSPGRPTARPRASSTTRSRSCRRRLVLRGGRREPVAGTPGSPPGGCAAGSARRSRRRPARTARCRGATDRSSAPPSGRGRGSHPRPALHRPTPRAARCH